jgi:hypothetical protein
VKTINVHDLAGELMKLGIGLGQQNGDGQGGEHADTVAWDN